MPMRAPRICQCGLRVASGAICICTQRRKVEADKRRPSARQRGYDSDWEAARAAFLAQPENRYCVCGCGRRADMVDHDRAHKGDRAIFWDRSNWRAMATQCHSAKTASRDGGFGNPNRNYQQPARSGP